MFRSLSHIYAQVIDDASGKTLAAASTAEKELQGLQVDEVRGRGRRRSPHRRTRPLAGVEHVVFDRAGFRYHGRIKSLADAARAAGLDF